MVLQDEPSPTPDPDVTEFGHDDWPKLQDFMSVTFGEGFANHAFVFRGEGERYDQCIPVIDRLLPPSVCGDDSTTRLQAEFVAMQRFRQIAPMHLDPSVQAVLDEGMQAQVVMRHYGAPTRLLDWTESPWVALFFACEDAAFSGDADVPAGRVIAFDRDILAQRVHEQFGKQTPVHATMIENQNGFQIPTMLTTNFTEHADDWVVPYARHASTFPRMHAQQGLFTLASKPWIDHWDQIKRFCPDAVREIHIDPHLKFVVLRHLLRMGLSRASLFADAEGVAREVGARVRLLFGEDILR